MNPKKAALHNHAQAQQKKQMTKRTFKIAIVVKPDGDWVALGGNEPENDRMSKALWGTPDGSFPAWAIVQLELPAHLHEPKTNASSEPVADEAMPVAPAPAGSFVGPGEELPIIDLEEPPRG